MPSDIAARSSRSTDPHLRGDVTARRARGGALLVGAALMVAMIETRIVAHYWLPALTGITYLASAAVGRSRGASWGPGLVITSVGVAAALWLHDGRPADSFQFLALAVMALGLGGVLTALLAQARGLTVTAMSVAMPVLLFGAFALLEQQAVAPFAGQTWPYAALLAVWGGYEIVRPDRIL